MSDLYKTIIENHNIKYLCHFTSIQNFVSICKYGILSRKEMEESNIKPIISDKDRYDGQFDKTSISISIPNSKMFTKKCYKDESRWIILLLDPILLLSTNLTPYFCSTNASSNKMINIINTNINELNSPFAFQNMFARGNSSKYPSDSQAEILIEGKINVKFIKIIIVYDQWTREIIENICNDMKMKIDVVVNPKYFKN